MIRLAEWEGMCLLLLPDVVIACDHGYPTLPGMYSTSLGSYRFSPLEEVVTRVNLTRVNLLPFAHSLVHYIS